MKETKVYVDELPKSCSYCPCFDVDNDECNITDCPVDYIGPSVAKPDDCPLIDIKAHDRELVKEVCEKIRKFCENNKYRCNKYFLLYSIGLNVKLLNKNKEGQKETFYEFLDQLQKEFEK